LQCRKVRVYFVFFKRFIKFELGFILYGNRLLWSRCFSLIAGIILVSGFYFFLKRGNIKFYRGRASADQYSQYKHPGAQKKNDQKPSGNFSA
jgi:hypothetical protein